MMAGAGAVRMLDAHKQGGAGLAKTVLQGLPANVTGRAFEETGNGRGAAHCQRVGKEGGIDLFSRATTPGFVDNLQNGERGSMGWVDRLVASLIEVGHHARDTVCESVELGGWKDSAMLTGR